MPVVSFLGVSLTATVWWGIKTIAPSKITFIGVSAAPGPDVGFTIGGPGTAGTGSYRGTDDGASSVATVTTAQSASAVLAKCTSSGGLGHLKVTAGSLHIG